MASWRNSGESLSSGHETVVLRHDAGEDGDVSASIVRAVSKFRGVDPTNISPQLGSVVDTDAIESLFPDPTEPGRSLVFEFADCEISISGDGRIAVSGAENSVAR